MSAYNDNNPPAQYRHDNSDERMQYPLSEFESRLDIQHHPASSSQIHPHPHPLFTCQENMNSNPNLNRSLDPQVITSHHSVYHSPSPFSAIQDQIPPPSQDSSHGWPLYDPQISHNFSHLNTRLNSSTYASPGYSNPSPFASTRSSPPAIHIPLNLKGQGHIPGLTFNTSSSSTPHHRPTLAGSLDPSTGIFYRTPEHPRLRTAQACEKCRTRKAKCSGEHPSCQRCLNRHLVCEYAKEGRVRGPNKPKPPKGGAGTTPTTTKKHADNVPSSSTNAPETSGQVQVHDSGGRTSSKSRHRALSDHSSSSSSEQHTDQLSSPIAIRGGPVHSETEEMAHSISPISPFPTTTIPGNVPGYRHLRRESSSLRSNRSSRPRLPDLHLDPSTELFQLPGPGDGARSATSDVSSDMGEMYRHSFHQHLLADQHEVSSYQFETSDMTFGSTGTSSGVPLQQQNHPDFLSQTGQAMHEYRRQYFSESQRSVGLVPTPGHSDRQGMDSMGVPQQSEGPMAGHHPQSHSLLEMDHVSRELSGAPVDEQLMYPPLSESYLHQHHQQQHQHQHQQQQRFYQRPFDSRSSGLDIGLGDKHDIKQEDSHLVRSSTCSRTCGLRMPSASGQTQKSWPSLGQGAMSSRLRR